jgi:alpha-tubulin suppressor-like RCC1 family protein
VCRALIAGFFAMMTIACGRIGYAPIDATSPLSNGDAAADFDAGLPVDGGFPTIDGGGAPMNDAGMNDAGMNDAGMNDAGMNDAGMNDAGMNDAGMTPSPARALALGNAHTCVLLDNGAVRCWGSNIYGQLGYANTNDIGDNETPASAGDVPLGGTAVQIATGANHTCALLDTGAVRCWGFNQEGELGYAHTSNIGDNETPASAGDVTLGGAAVEIAAGEYHTCARLDTGTVRCWGKNMHGELGYSNTSAIGDNETPASAGDVTLGGTALKISAGGYSTCVLLGAGAVRCWGYNNFGQLGYGNTNSIGDNETPASAGNVSLGGNAIQISVGAQNACAVVDTGALRCWGYGLNGALGYGNTNNIGDNETPASAGDVLLGGAIVHVATSGHTCALLDTGAVRCWGFGSRGQLGYANTITIGDNETPASVGDVMLGVAARLIGTGGAHTCAVLDTGAVRCWGTGARGRLGYGNTIAIGDDETPASAGDVLFQ